MTIVEANERNLKLLGWTQFSMSGKWISPGPNHVAYDSFDDAWAAAMNPTVSEQALRRIGMALPTISANVELWRKFGQALVDAEARGDTAAAKDILSGRLPLDDEQDAGV
jgi:hypothetical protein